MTIYSTTTTVSGRKKNAEIDLLKCRIIVYSLTTHPGCQNRKSTYVNNRCILSRNIRIITLTVDGLMNAIVTPTRRYYLPTPPLGQDMTQGQFLSGV